MTETGEKRRRFAPTHEEKSWMAYDAGNSAFTMLVSSIFPIYFASLAARDGISAATSTTWWGYALAASTLVIAILSPLLGPVADCPGMKRKLFNATLNLGLVGAVGMGLVDGWLAYILLFVMAKIGYNGSLVFYDSMLTDITDDERMDAVSSTGYAVGYLASCVPFIACIALIQTADMTGIGKLWATRIGFFLTAAWWLAFTIPLWRTYRQKYFTEARQGMLRETISRLWQTLRSMREQKHIFLFMLAFFFYIDGVYTIIGMAASYGNAVGIDSTSMIFALLLTQIVAFPFAILFGRIARRFHPRRLIMVCIGGYICITLFAIQLDKAWEFWFLAVMVAVFQGGIQALSRSYFARMIPKERSNEYFGLFNIFGKYADFFGPLLMSITIALTGIPSLGVASIVLLFVVGFVLMLRLEKYDDGLRR